jgi:signal peptidase I
VRWLLVSVCLVAGLLASGLTASARVAGGIPTVTVPLRVVYLVRSSGMEPALRCAIPGLFCTAVVADRVVVKEPAGSLARGDVVAFNSPPSAVLACGAGGVYVKRLIGLPGEIWSEKNGYVYINGKKLDEPYIRPEYRDDSTYPLQKIPAGQYFMMGDNRSGSCDSRRFGAVPRADILGKVIRVIRP